MPQRGTEQGMQPQLTHIPIVTPIRPSSSITDNYTTLNQAPRNNYTTATSNYTPNNALTVQNLSSIHKIAEDNGKAEDRQHQLTNLKKIDEQLEISRKMFPS